ncbi:glycoside hydrolase N-terminal domain-containing protein [Streptomyces sp. NPDC001312]|uniref:glycosyl hydrolase family 95 catalytic domain-containing protein n=1 Tax=Streptomyces sp. NPDC001312 TaxID=3364561 RepID=UPI00369EFEDD
MQTSNVFRFSQGIQAIAAERNEGQEMSARKVIGSISALVVALPLWVALVHPASASPRGASPAAAAAAPDASDQTPLRLWYTSPAGDSTTGWLDQSLPLGNGHIGVNVFGGVSKERLQVTDNSLQDLDPYSTSDRIGGLNSFAEIYLNFPQTTSTNYTRDLNLNDATAHVHYDSDGVTYTREYFTDYPDKVLAMKLTASQPGKLSFTLAPKIPYVTASRRTGDSRGKTGKVTAQGDTITLAGQMNHYHELFEGQLKVVPTGGTMTAANDTTGDNGTISVAHADSAVVFFTEGTNYKPDAQSFSEDDPAKKLAGNPDPHAAVVEEMADAAAKGYDGLLAAHQADYHALYNRADVNLGVATPTVSTDKLVDQARSGSVSPYLEELAFQYGRYLLISSSRAGGLPPNLQGTWNVYQDPPWGSGYWHNVNQQMNYWPAFETNLAETFQAYVDFNKAYRPAAEQYADKVVKQYNPSMLDPNGDNGWAIGNSMWPFHMGGRPAHSGFGTGPWTAQMFWDYYDFTRSQSVLKNVTYPTLAGMANFLSRFVTDHNGLLLADPSQSPENSGPEEPGTTFDQQQIYENGRNTLSAARALGISNALTDRLTAQIPKYDPVIVGESGQIKEYRSETTYGSVGDPKHRHISQLLGLFPGQLINSKTPAWLDAAKTSLNGRGNVAGTGWGQAMRISAWANVGDGDRARSFLTYWLSHHAMHNMWNNHNDSLSSRTFQVDGNFGVTAGVAEMLLQSQDEVVSPLAALPSAWKDGSYRGLVARGGFEVAATWSSGHADRLAVTSDAGGLLRLRYPGVAAADVRDGQGNPVSTHQISSDEIQLPTRKGQTYVVTNIPTVSTVAAPSKVTVTADSSKAVKLTWTTSADATGYNVYRADESSPSYRLLAGNLQATGYVDQHAATDPVTQSTYRVVAVGAGQREGGAQTVTRLVSGADPDHVLSVNDDLFSFGTGSGQTKPQATLDGADQVGMTWRSGRLTDITLNAVSAGTVNLQNSMFTVPVTVVDSRGDAVPAKVKGKTLELTTQAGETYEIGPTVAVTASVPDGTVRPGTDVPVAVTVHARQDTPAGTMTVTAPNGLAATPTTAVVPALNAGASFTQTITVSVPGDTDDGRYPGSLAVAVGKTTYGTTFTISVELPNLALGKSATQSSNYNSASGAALAVDGNTNGAFKSGSVTNTKEDAASENQPWWQVDLGSSQSLGSVKVWNRTDSCCVNRLGDWYVLVSDQPFGTASLSQLLATDGVWSSHQTTPPTPSTEVQVSAGVTGRYVRIQLSTTNAPLSMAEVQVYPPRTTSAATAAR